MRYYLTGNKTGQSDVFIDNLPGVPDNIRFNDKEEMWIALPQLREKIFDYTFKSTFLRNLLGKLPRSIM